MQRHSAAPWRRWLSVLLWSAGLGGLWVALGMNRVQAGMAAQDFAFPVDRASWPLIVPMVAASASLERSLELFWNFVEWSLLRIGGWQPADLKRADYQQLKSGLSLLIANVLGVSIASYTDVRLLRYLQPEAMGFFDQVPASWDILLSGVLIGSGTKPIHDALGIVTRLKSLVGNVALRQRENAHLFAADAEARLQEQRYLQQTRTLAAHRPTVRAAPSLEEQGDEEARTESPARQTLRHDLAARYES